MKKTLVLVIGVLMLFAAALAEGSSDGSDKTLTLEELIEWKIGQRPEFIRQDDINIVESGNLYEEYYGYHDNSAESVGMKSFVTCDKTMFVVGETSVLVSHTTGGTSPYIYRWNAFRAEMGSFSDGMYDWFGLYGEQKDFAITPDGEYRYLIDLMVTDSEGNYISYQCTYDTVTAESFSDDTTLGGKVKSVVAEVTDDSMTDYDKALALHEWLTHNAYYDLTYSYYYPDGVLLLGTGVCDSYAKAYQMLCTEVGIPCLYVSSEEMCHAWNMIYVNGGWYHVDVTWDDPVSYEHDGMAISGYENTRYFCVSDAFLAQDHSWNEYDDFGQLVPRTGPGSLYPEDGGNIEPEPAAELEIGDYIINIPGGDMAVFTFIAPTDGLFAFYTMGDTDTIGSLYDMSGNLILRNDDGNGSDNFYILVRLSEGETVKLEVEFCHLPDGGEVELRVRHMENAGTPADVFDVTTLNGRTVSSDAAGKPRLIFFSNVGCGNSYAMMYTLAGYDLTAVNAIITDGCGNTLEETIGNLEWLDLMGAVMGYGSVYDMWNMLGKVGIDDSIYTPAVFYIDGNNNIVHFTTGYDGRIVENVQMYLGVTLEKIDYSSEVLYLPASLTEIGVQALAGTSAKVIVVPEDCTAIAEDAFADCPNLKIIVNKSYLPVDAPAGVVVTDLPGL